VILYAISSPDWEVRAISARLLGQRQEKGVPEALLHIARTDKHLEVRKYAIESFKSITGSNVMGVFNIDGFEKWWKEHYAEVNERLADMR
jgi:HEAT repeats